MARSYPTVAAHTFRDSNNNAALATFQGRLAAFAKAHDALAVEHGARASDGRRNLPGDCTNAKPWTGLGGAGHRLLHLKKIDLQRVVRWQSNTVTVTPGCANAHRMTGSAKQSKGQRKKLDCFRLSLFELRRTRSSQGLLAMTLRGLSLNETGGLIFLRLSPSGSRPPHGSRPSRSVNSAKKPSASACRR
jgi:hypothetical protein